MVCNPILRHNAAPIRHVCIVPESEDACCWDLGWEEGLGPGLGCAGGHPCLLAVARQAMDEDNATKVSQLFRQRAGRRTRQRRLRGCEVA